MLLRRIDRIAIVRRAFSKQFFLSQFLIEVNKAFRRYFYTNKQGKIMIFEELQIIHEGENTSEKILYNHQI